LFRGEGSTDKQLTFDCDNDYLSFDAVTLDFLQSFFMFCCLLQWWHYVMML